ncbi:menaquinone biosynthesis prenyltransferase MqnP [Helicobacter sp. 13S00477-4]|uniref:menaquinone biosynthesis prenyltransferase MqnP n=1 Tax=Helicobacter sp. 13S00477-4 TaxID=1905759 RepID=UPI000BA63F15|nr:menaquinone biosynthesis prenyltransferase MqnP [Helicobacter sp. 13S00477-4]PAF52120.1 4-hydroxybenzoate polyprenyltransferase [Helicobacter sp. 13S00477-4]
MFKKLINFSELVVFQHTIFSGAFILISMIVASVQLNQSVWFGFKTLFLCLLALMSARNFAMAFNRYCDKDIDVKNERTNKRPSVDGRISTKSILVFCIFNALIFIGVSYLINHLAFYLSIPFLIVLGGYSYMKRISYLAHLVLGLSLGLAPIAGAIAIEGQIPLWSLFLCLGVIFWVAGFDLLYSLQDIHFDRKEGLYSIPAAFGVPKTLMISRLFHVLAVIFWGLFVYFSNGWIFAYIGLFVSMLMLIYEQYLVSLDFRNIPKAFFVSNGYLGFIFFIFILFDGIGRTYGI